MKFYNPWEVALKNDDTVLGMFSFLSIIFTAIGIIWRLFVVGFCTLFLLVSKL